MSAAKAMDLAIGLTRHLNPKVMEEVIALEDETDRYQDALGTNLVKLSGKRLSVDNNRRLNTVKAGELHESAAFAERFAKYKEKYTFLEEE